MERSRGRRRALNYGEYQVCVRVRGRLNTESTDSTLLCHRHVIDPPQAGICMIARILLSTTTQYTPRTRRPGQTPLPMLYYSVYDIYHMTFSIAFFASRTLNGAPWGGRVQLKPLCGGAMCRHDCREPEAARLR